MKIVDIRLRQVTGTLEHPGEFWEERLIRPIDVYPEHKAEGPQWLPKVAEGRYRVESIFVEVLTDEGVTGPRWSYPPRSGVHHRPSVQEPGPGRGSPGH